MKECNNTNPYGMNEYREDCKQNCEECDYWRIKDPETFAATRYNTIAMLTDVIESMAYAAEDRLKEVGLYKYSIKSDIEHIKKCATRLRRQANKADKKQEVAFGDLSDKLHEEICKFLEI